MRLTTRIVWLGASALVVGGSLAFAPHSSMSSVKRHLDTSPRSSSLLFFFNRNKQDGDDKDITEENERKEDGKQPFFARFLERMQPTEQAEKPAETTTNETYSPHATEQKESKVPALEAPKKEQTPLEKAQAMRAQAERMRLEAERMDAQLTLDKIERLEVELKQAKKKGESVEELQREMEALQAKMRGEAPKPIIASSTPSPKSETAGDATGVTASPTDSATTSSTDAQPVDKKIFQEKLDEYEKAPDVMKLIIAGSVGLYSPDVKDVNATEVALRLEMMQRSDYSFLGDVPKPVFSQEEIEKTKNYPLFRASCKLEGKDEDEVARAVLEGQYYSKIMQKQLESSMEDNPFFQIELTGNFTELDGMAESLFPNACRKEGETPTMAQANILVADVLPKAGFNPSGKPEPIEGGYIIRGTNKLDNGDALIESIDEKLQKSSIGGKMSVFYINDFTVFTEDQLETNFNPGHTDPILLVTGPNVYREPRRLLYSAVSAFGIASSWYLSIYPFLLNPDLMKRAEEQMSLADANMAYDLTWLTDLSLPLFLTFMGIQLTHEIGHRAVAAAYGMNITVPTFVPSLITGITSAVTTFKSPPKNREAMFDFAIAGPFAGIIASVVALYFGLQFTLYSTAEAAAQFPALPLEILRQSTLGGGIIEYMLGAGALAVPGGSEGTSAISSITIPLHPVAIAGYISLIVNALALLPIGTTDGGRIAMTLFSRGAKLVVGQLFLIVLFTLGIFGSDLFLFYFSFLIFFQQGNEIPSRNEVDEVSFSRVLLATVAGVVSLLALIPIS